MTRPAPRSATLAGLLALGLAGCELVIGGENHAMIRSQDGGIENVDASDAASEATRDSAASEATRDSVAAAADVAVHDDEGPPGPCMAPPPCVQSENSCVNDCMGIYGGCMMGMMGPGDPHGNQCKKSLDDCTATCEASCTMCAGCPKPAPGCMVP